MPRRTLSLWGFFHSATTAPVHGVPVRGTVATFAARYFPTPGHGPEHAFLGNIDPAAHRCGMYQQYRNGPRLPCRTDWARFFEGFDLARTRNIPSFPANLLPPMEWPEKAAMRMWPRNSR
jgi:hypothetical protein